MVEFDAMGMAAAVLDVEGAVRGARTPLLQQAAQQPLRLQHQRPGFQLLEQQGKTASEQGMVVCQDDLQCR